MRVRPVMLQLLAVALLWGCNYVASAYLLLEFSPVLLAFTRLAFTSLQLFIISLFYKALKKPIKREWLLLFLIGVTSSLLYQIFYFLGLTNSSAGNAALIIALSPIATTLLARVFLKETITGLKLLGAVVALFGVVVIVLNGGKVTGVSHGDFIILLAMFMLATSVLLIRKATVTMNSLDVTIYSTIMGTVLMMPAVGIEFALGKTQYSSSLFSWGLLIIAALIGQGLAGLWWNRAISVVGASTSAMFMNIPPVVAIIVAYIVLGDPIRMTQIAGGLLIAIGVAVANKKLSNKPGLSQAHSKSQSL